MNVDEAILEPIPPAHLSNGTVNGVSNGFPSPESLEKELPVVTDGQVALGDLLSRVMQAIYAELSELAETMPNMSDTARKRTLADWVVKTKKQVVKLYAVSKWSRDADTVQKCMNITAFLMDQNQQFQEAITRLNYARESLDPARLRNHDLLTSLDVLTKGSYLRLPTAIKKMVIPPVPLTDLEVVRTLTDVEDMIRLRLRLKEVVPVEMSNHRIVNGRVYFKVPDLFETSVCLRGAEDHDGWFFVHVEFLFQVGGDLTGTQDFPRQPTGTFKRFITDEADHQLGRYIPADEQLPSQVDLPERPQLPTGTVDTPLIRLYNLLQMLSLSYQLEILWYQAERLCSLGWRDFLEISMGPNRKVMTASYWRRLPTHMPGKPKPSASYGGRVTIEIKAVNSAFITSNGPATSPKAQALADIQYKSKISAVRPSDEVEALAFHVTWEPFPRVFGLVVPPEQCVLSAEALAIDATNIDLEAILKGVLHKHIQVLLSALQLQIQRSASVFSRPGVVSLVDDNEHALRVHLCADEVVFITLDPRTGRLNLRDSGDLAAAGRAPRFAMMTTTVNDNPAILTQALIKLRLLTITDSVEQKAKYLGLQTFRQRNFMKEEFIKLGPSARGTLFIQLANFPNHYLVIIITDEAFQYALITTSVITDSMFGSMVMEDIAWLDVARIRGRSPGDPTDLQVLSSELNDIHPISSGSSRPGFDLDTQTLRELYSYCCARVAYMNVERQLKLRGIPFTHVNPTKEHSLELGHIQSSLARSVPALCVQSADILSGAPAAEAAMPNIRVIPLNWWSEKNAQVVTCVKLKYVQQPLGKTAGTSAVIRPSKRIIYDTNEAVVSFLSENVNTCVDEFLEEWARVSKMVVIAREVAQMATRYGWNDVRLLSFDLRTVEFAYASDFSVALSYEDQLLMLGGHFDLRFSRCALPSPENDIDMDPDRFNPHDDAEAFLRQMLRQGQGQLAPSLHRLVSTLRGTLPIVTVLEEIRRNSEKTTDASPMDTFAKAAGWYRLLYGDLRHALDFRYMTDDRIAVLDASYSVFGDAYEDMDLGSGGLQPIPGIRDAANEVVKESLKTGAIQPRQAALVDVGLVCDADAVKVLTRALHAKIEVLIK